MFATGAAIFSSPAIAPDGTVYIGSGLDVFSLFALKPDGTQKWVFTTGGWILSSPVIGADGTIFVNPLDDDFYAINPDGTLKWIYNTGQTDVPISSPAIGPDGTVYTCGSSQLDPREFVGGIDGLSVACGACGCRPANPSWRPQAANLEPSPRCCWRGSPCVIKSPCWSAAELVARAFRRWDRLFWILFSRWWPHWRDSLIIVQPETVLRRGRHAAWPLHR